MPQRELAMISEQLSENNYTKWVDFAQILLEQQAKEDRELDNH